MEKLELYRKHVQELLSEYAAAPLIPSDLETQLVFDTVRDRYLVMMIGWRGNSRAHEQVIHIDIKDGQIWIQHNATDLELAKTLVERGVPKSDIVLGFQSPFMRRHSGYGGSNQAA